MLNRRAVSLCSADVHARSVSPVQVCLGFHEKSVKKNFFGFGAKEEKVYWERWIIPITATNDKEKQTSQAGAALTTAAATGGADAERRMGRGCAGSESC